MDLTSLYDWLFHLSPFTPLIVCAATVLDIFFLTGFIFYGAAMMSAILMLLMTNMISVEALLISAFIGSTLGNVVNYWVGRSFGTTEFVTKRLQNQKIQRFEQFLERRGLLVFMIVGRFITFTRPLYALLLGSLGVSFRRFLVRELPLTLVWVSFWLWVILQGESVLTKWF